MLDLNFFLFDSVKKHIDYLIRHPEVFVIESNKYMPVHYDRMPREMIRDFPNLDKFAVGYICAMVAAVKDGPKMLVPSYEDCMSLEHTMIKVPCSEYEQPYPAMLIEFPYKYYEYMVERWKRPQPKGAVVYHVKHANMIIIALIYKHPEFSNITVFFETQFDCTIEEAFIILDHQGVHDEDTIIAKFYQRIVINLMLIMTSLGHQKYNYPVRQRKVSNCEDIVLVGLKQNIKMFRKEVNIGSREGLDHERKSPHPHWRQGYHRMQHYGKGNTLTRRTFIPPVFVCSNRYGGDMTDTGVTYHS